MKLVFVDETDRQANAQSHEFFCICGLIIDEKHLVPATNQLEDIKNKYNLTNLKDSRKKNLSEAEKISLTEEILKCLTKYDVVIIAIVLGSFSMSSKLPKEDTYMGSLSFLLERFGLGLIKEQNTGVVIFDSMNESLQKKLRKKFYDYVRTESIKMAWEAKPKGAMKDYVLPTLLFTEDDQSLLIQAVDLIATSLNSAIVNTSRGSTSIDVDNLPNGNKFLAIYWPLFVRSSAGKVSGWGIKVWD